MHFLKFMHRGKNRTVPAQSNSHHCYMVKESATTNYFSTPCGRFVLSCMDLRTRRRVQAANDGSRRYARNLQARRDRSIKTYPFDQIEEAMKDVGASPCVMKIAPVAARRSPDDWPNAWKSPDQV